MAARGMTGWLAASAAVLAIGGCAGTPGATALQQDIDFIRGCWVSKEAPGGQIISFLRLLPPSPGDVVLEGEIHPVASLYADKARRFSFARDGSTATLDYLIAGKPAETYTRDRASVSSAKDGYRAVYARSDRESALLVLEGSNERLKIFTAARDSATTNDQFTGERDGCD